MNPQNPSGDFSGSRVDFQPGETISPRSVPTPDTSTIAPVATAVTDSSLPQAQPALTPQPASAPQPPTEQAQASEPAAFVPPAASVAPFSTPAPASVASQSSFAREAFTPAASQAESAEQPLEQPSFVKQGMRSFAASENDDQDDVVDDGRAVTWTASEFIAHHKSSGWYMALAGGAVAAAILIYLITQDVISTIMVLFGALVFGISASRQPRQLQYTVDNHGLTIGNKSYPYHNFRTFAVIDEYSFASITFMPLKRFAPSVTIYYAPEDEDSIIDIIADHLPMQEHMHDPVDRLMRRIRF